METGGSKCKAPVHILQHYVTKKVLLCNDARKSGAIQFTCVSTVSVGSYRAFSKVREAAAEL